MIKEKSSYKSISEGETLTIKIIGEIDHHNAVRLRENIDGEIYSMRPKKLIFDLSDVDFMDSSGLGLMLGRYASVKNVGGELVIKHPNRNVMKILKLAGAERILKIETDKSS